ncbi:glucose-1-phosphate thymidylyltransferase [Spongiactinospora rosea]|uniref:Glucose-1-phosphate thymidylyltransferase n=1 Tax=Spongiactinospora rosea TaxID=2248750 RepID=A0A366M4W3_9ACTN|nr:glucose-1-phosphate thymidylyltransferase [Spongiactinospora rosea]RBQ20790.1 glucose-1-phosphate thymidylyltransferase [Spongiactinospora rosea]
MKALVLAGGRGTRLRPFTHTVPKQLVPVANKPVLFYGLEAIKAAGITDVGIIVGDHGPAIQSAVGDGAAFGLNIAYIEQHAPLGLAHCVMIAQDFLGDADFLLYLGDNVIIDGVGPLLDAFWRSRPDAMVMTGKVGNPSEYGVAEVGPGGVVTGLAEKPATPRSDLALVGAYVFTPVIHQAVRSIKPSWRNEREITDAIDWLLRSGWRVESHLHGGYWKDTGKAEDLLECNRAVLDTAERSIKGQVDDTCVIHGPVIIEEGAQVSGSRITGPAVIGVAAVVRDSQVGPYTSIGADCDIAGAAIENSVVCAGSTVRGSLRNSLIGREAKVSGDIGRPASLVLGDHSQALLHGAAS